MCFCLYILFLVLLSRSGNVFCSSLVLGTNGKSTSRPLFCLLSPCCQRFLMSEGVQNIQQISCDKNSAQVWNTNRQVSPIADRGAVFVSWLCQGEGSTGHWATTGNVITSDSIPVATCVYLYILDAHYEWVFIEYELFLCSCSPPKHSHHACNISRCDI